MDALAQQTDVRGGEASAWYNATRYNYSATTTSSNGIWSKSYNIIANVNFLLENLEKKKEMFVSCHVRCHKRGGFRITGIPAF